MITTFFRGNYSAARFAEIVTAARLNLVNPHVRRLHLLVEGDSDPAVHIARDEPSAIAALVAEKLVARRVAEQPTYAQLLAYANEALPRGTVAIVTNGDIYFDATLACIGHAPRTGMASTVQPMIYALSRRHAKQCGFANDHKKIFDLCSTYVGSHDAFVFTTPVPPSVIANSNHTQNHYGAENIVIYEFRQANYQVRNPCTRIKAFHLHCTKDRDYDQHHFVSHGRHARQPPPHAPLRRVKHKYEIEGQQKIKCGAHLTPWHEGVPRRVRKSTKKTKKKD